MCATNRRRPGHRSQRVSRSYRATDGPLFSEAGAPSTNTVGGGKCWAPTRHDRPRHWQIVNHSFERGAVAWIHGGSGKATAPLANWDDTSQPTDGRSWRMTDVDNESEGRARRRRSGSSLSQRRPPVPDVDQGRRGPSRAGDRERQRCSSPAERGNGFDGSRARRAAPLCPPRCRRAADVRAGKPAPGCFDRQEVSGVWSAAPRPDPGGQPRPDSRGRQVRLAQRIQVLDVCDMVDPPVDHPRYREHRADDPLAIPCRQHARAGPKGAGDPRARASPDRDGHGARSRGPHVRTQSH